VMAHGEMLSFTADVLLTDCDQQEFPYSSPHILRQFRTCCTCSRTRLSRAAHVFCRTSTVTMFEVGPVEWPRRRNTVVGRGNATIVMLKEVLTQNKHASSKHQASHSRKGDITVSAPACCCVVEPSSWGDVHILRCREGRRGGEPRSLRGHTQKPHESPSLTCLMLRLALTLAAAAPCVSQHMELPQTGLTKALMNQFLAGSPGRIEEYEAKNAPFSTTRTGKGWIGPVQELKDGVKEQTFLTPAFTLGSGEIRNDCTCRRFRTKSIPDYA
jgi:hypothetical protein